MNLTEGHPPQALLADAALLPDKEWRTSYRNEDGDLIELFYNPALTCAVQYDRMTGYFSADALALASRGIDALITNDGRMRLIVGCTLQQPEQDAIGEGYDWRARLEAHLLAADLTPPDEAAGRGLEMVAWMVAQGHLDVKVAVPIDPDGRPAHAQGLYHEKVGVLTDAEGNQLSFSGSINETAEAGSTTGKASTCIVVGLAAEKPPTWKMRWRRSLDFGKGAHGQ